MFGTRNPIDASVRDRVRADVVPRLFEACPDAPDPACAMVDTTIVTRRRHGQGANGGLGAGTSAARAAA
jgi:hypothetical protein